MGYIQGEFDLHAYSPKTGALDGSYDIEKWLVKTMFLGGSYDLLAYKILSGWVNGSFDLLAYNSSVGFVSGSYDQVVYTTYQGWLSGEYSLEKWLTKQGALNGAYDLQAFKLLSGFLSGEYQLNAMEAVIGFLTAAYDLQAADIFYGTFTNLDTGAFAQFENYNFNSFAGDMGANANGIYTLSGDTDAGTFIDTVIETGKDDFETSYLKRVTDAYLGLTSDGCLKLTVTTESGTDQYVISEFGDLGSKKVNLARGAKGRYCQARIDNIDGAQMELDSLEFITHIMRRRAR